MQEWLQRVLLLAALLIPSASAASSGGDPAAPNGAAEELLDGPFEGVAATDEIFEPPGVTGDWGGTRTRLSERGIDLSLDLTQGLQGVMSGGFDEGATYLGSSELILDLDGEKLGLWPGGFARIAVEGRFGRDVLGKAA